MNLADELYRSITSHHRRIDTEATSLASMLSELTAHYGTGPKAARALGIPGRTWRRWAHGDNRPKHDRWVLLKLAQRRIRLSATRERFLRGTPNIVVWAGVRVSEDERDRKLLVSGWPDSDPNYPITGMMGPVLDAWLKGHDNAASAAFLAPINGGVDGEVTFTDVYEIKFYKSRGDALRFVARA